MTRWILIGIGVILLLIIIGFFIYPKLLKTLKPNATPNPFPISITTPTNSPTPTATVSATPASSYKTYQGDGFVLNYPSNWGLLTCANSKDFEFDPINSSDQMGVSCDYAQKPISVQIIEKPNDCPGDKISLGQTSLTKSQTTTSKYTEYKWCTMTHPSLIFTERVGSSPDRAVSSTNYSNQIEKVIESFSF
jgi:hypothetical protein